MKHLEGVLNDFWTPYVCLVYILRAGRGGGGSIKSASISLDTTKSIIQQSEPKFCASSDPTCGESINIFQWCKSLAKFLAENKA